jgi:hypothetical protein
MLFLRFKTGIGGAESSPVAHAVFYFGLLNFITLPACIVNVKPLF